MANQSRYPVDSDNTAVNVLTTSATELSRMLANSTTTTSKLLPLYLNQIDRHNHKGLHLNAMISIAPLDSLKAQAALLDAERGSGKLRGPFHGIPITVKDNIMTEATLGMDTTCGSFALKGVKVKRNADIVTAVLEAGLLIIGKANLSVCMKRF
jgi:amidase